MIFRKFVFKTLSHKFNYFAALLIHSLFFQFFQFIFFFFNFSFFFLFLFSFLQIWFTVNLCLNLSTFAFCSIIIFHLHLISSSSLTLSHSQPPSSPSPSPLPGLKQTLILPQNCLHQWTMDSDCDYSVYCVFFFILTCVLYVKSFEVSFIWRIGLLDKLNTSFKSNPFGAAMVRYSSNYMFDSPADLLSTAAFANEIFKTKTKTILAQNWTTKHKKSGQNRPFGALGAEMEAQYIPVSTYNIPYSRQLMDGGHLACWDSIWVVWNVWRTPGAAKRDILSQNWPFWGPWGPRRGPIRGQSVW